MFFAVFSSSNVTLISQPGSLQSSRGLGYDHMCDVLLLDDDSLIRLTLLDVLDGFGLDVREAASVSAAQAVLQEPAGCRLLIADRDLGNAWDLDGFTFAVRAMRLLPGLRVIYITGQHDVLNDRVLTPRERAVPKPFAPGQLIDVARELLAA